MDTCPYCGEEQRALKNHVRLASGDGHGPSGTYPDDFEAGTSPGPPPASEDDADGHESAPDAHNEDQSQDLPATDDTDTVEMTPDEIDDMIDAAAEAAYDSGYQEAQEEQEPIEVESTVDETDSGTVPRSQSGCPECGGTLNTDVAGGRFIASDGQVVGLEKGDGLCESCDVVVGNEGEVIYGSESKKADSTPPCSKCGNNTVSADYALHIIGEYYRKTSSLRVLARRRLKKMAGNIEKRDPNYVCPSCWTAFG